MGQHDLIRTDRTVVGADDRRTRPVDARDVRAFEDAHASVEHITNDLWGGWLVRGMHRWGASVFIILMFMHMGRVFLFGAYKYPRELNWIVGVLILATGLFEGLTGYLLPWDQIAFWAVTIGNNIASYVPIFSRPSQLLIFGGVEVSQNTLLRFYVLHVILLPLAGVKRRAIDREQTE